MDLDALYDHMRRTRVEGWPLGYWGANDGWRSHDGWASRLAAHQYRPLFRLLDRYAAPDARVLDWGSGPGRLSFCLLAAGYEVDGYDLVAPPNLECIQGEGGERYRFTLGEDPTTLPYGDGSFDVVV